MARRELVCSFEKNPDLIYPSRINAGTQINAGTPNKRRGRLSYTRPCRPGVYLNPAFNRESTVHAFEHFRPNITFRVNSCELGQSSKVFGRKTTVNYLTRNS